MMTLSKMLGFILSSLTLPTLCAQALPQGFVYLEEVAPSIIQDIRYATDDNFVGRPIRGYHAKRCVLTRQAADALASAQQELLIKGYSLKVFDAYRPQKACNDFYAWSHDGHDQKMKAQYFPNEEKATLFAKGYIAQFSGHSRGSTVDVTLVKLAPITSNLEAQVIEIEMGTPFDFFDTQSHTDAEGISLESSRNRLFLKDIMERHGFKNLKEEWWHYTLIDEPFSHQYFDFTIE